MLSGVAVEVEVTSFQNDMVGFANLIHLGYFEYDQNTRRTFIPNKEIRQELTRAVKRKKWKEMIIFQQESEHLLEAILDMDEEVVRELPTVCGFADFAFIPKTESASSYPALIVKLKWNKSAKTALQQIREKKYPESIEQYTGDILLVGINYDKKTKKHQYLIEKYKK